MHRFVAAQYPQLRVLSFVDNWDFLTWNAQAATQQLDALLEFAALADLTVDRQKNICMVNLGWHESLTQSSGHPSPTCCQDLGAHVAFSRQHTNSTVTGRLEALGQFWPQLRNSKAGYKSKLRALRTVAWPRGLFAVESAPISDSTWLAQRRHANQALGMDKPGVKSFAPAWTCWSLCWSWVCCTHPNSWWDAPQLPFGLLGEWPFPPCQWNFCIAPRLHQQQSCSGVSPKDWCCCHPYWTLARPHWPLPPWPCQLCWALPSLAVAMEPVCGDLCPTPQRLPRPCHGRCDCNQTSAWPACHWWAKHVAP